MPQPQPSIDRLIRKEEALGTLRSLDPPQSHIGLSQIAPWLEVGSDDVIFDFAKTYADGLAPARAEDAEAELAQKDIIFGGQGRASLQDWGLKDFYTASAVMRYSEARLVSAQAGVIGITTPANTSQAQDFQTQVVKDDADRKKKLDNRIEWLIMTALSTGAIAYNDGKIKFSVDFGRPAGQHNQAPGSGLWSTTGSDPIGDVKAMQEYMWDTYSVRMDRAIISKKIRDSVWNSDKFTARFAPVVGGTPSAPIDVNYLYDGWGPDAAFQVFARATGVTYIEYDSVYRTRTPGSTTTVNNRFLPQNTIIFLPNEEDVAAIDDTALQFGRTLTAPHPEGNWESGFYEWEERMTDPWGVSRGTGVKAFPIFPHMDLTFTMTVLA